MLVLKRQSDEGVIVWNEKSPTDQLRVSFRKLPDGTYQLAFDGPRSFKIFREEMLQNECFKSEK